MAYYIYNGIKLPALPSGLNEFNYILRSGDFYYLASATAEEKTINADGTIRVSSSEGIFYTFSDGAWVENSNDSAIGYVVWSNTDVYDSTGTLYLAATDPLPVGKPIEDPLSFMMGWQLGQRLRMRGRKPIGYLYNGVFIKGEVPEYDEKAYPYMFIQGGDTPRLIVSEFGLMYYPNAITPGVGWRDYENNIGKNVCETMILSINDGVCGEFASEFIAIVGGTTQFDPVVWTSHEIQNSSDGTTYLEASDPIPVYE